MIIITLPKHNRVMPGPLRKPAIGNTGPRGMQPELARPKADLFPAAARPSSLSEVFAESLPLPAVPALKAAFKALKKIKFNHV